MKTGKTLTQLALEIERQQNAKQDMIAPTTMMRVESNLVEGRGEIALAMNSASMGNRSFAINSVGHDQIGTHTGIPSKYYDKMLAEAPGLLGENINTWFRKYPAKRMVRTLDGTVRAFLSDSYRPLENFDLAEAVLPVLMDLNLTVMSAEITDRRMYIKAVDSRIERDIPQGYALGDGKHRFFDTVSPAVIIGNSEVGMGSLYVESGVWRKVCTNLAAIPSAAGMKKRHLGSKFEGAVDEVRHLLTDETKRATDKAVWMQVRDVVKGAFEEARFEALVEKIGGMKERTIEADTDVVKMVTLASRKLDITEGESKSVLKHLIAGGELSQFGLWNAITRTAQDVESYDRASELERIGGGLIDLPANDWRELAKAA